MSHKLLAVYTTTSNAEEARKIAQTLVERQLAACVQINTIESFYRWEGAVQNDPEYRLMVKTTASHYPSVETAILEMHSYELPAIYAVAIEEAYAPYAAWVEQCEKATY
jgi:periplasmic divalent cation tolerance protein